MNCDVPKLKKLKFHFCGWLELGVPFCFFILQDTAVNTHEYKDVKKQLKRHLKNAESTLKDVSLTVQVVENDRIKFAHIDDSQLFERKSLVDTSRGRIQHAKDEMNSESVKGKLLVDERNKAVRRSGDGLLGATSDAERQNTSFILDNQAQTSLLMKQQDETLDELGEVVIRVGEMAGNIHEEIGHQNKMLDELDQDMTNAEEELGLVMGKLAKFLHTKDPWQLRTIMFLSLTVVVLFFLVIYS
jgi:syntaxin 6